MPYQIALSESARRFYEHADAPLQRKLDRCFAALAIAPRTGNNVRRLTGPYAGMYRYRIGSYRVVYDIVDDRVEVWIQEITSRGDAYR